MYKLQGLYTGHTPQAPHNVRPASHPNSLPQPDAMRQPPSSDHLYVNPTVTPHVLPAPSLVPLMKDNQLMICNGLPPNRTNPGLITDGTQTTPPASCRVCLHTMNNRRVRCNPRCETVTLVTRCICIPQKGKVYMEITSSLAGQLLQVRNFSFLL